MGVLKSVMFKINLAKAKEIVHQKRRIARAMEFAPYDEIVMKQIPGEIKSAEKERKLIRTKYEKIQEQVDQTENLQDLKAILETFTQTTQQQ